MVELSCLCCIEVVGYYYTSEMVLITSCVVIYRASMLVLNLFCRDSQ